MKSLTKKELFTIPNLICYLRIILIPIFCFVYVNASTKEEYMLATGIVLFSSFTDLFDGMIARKFNQVTELGKVLDPVADKLTHAALALCLAFRYPFMWALIALMIVKEGYMAIMGIKYLKQDKMMDGAMWYGKVCTATIFISMVVLFFFYDMPILYVNLIIGVTMAVMVFTLIKYILFYRQMGKELKQE